MASYSQHPTMFKANPLGFIGCIIILPVGIFILFWWYLTARTTVFSVEGQEVSFEKGILNKEHSEVSMANIRTVKVKQSLLERLFGVGTVEIYTAGDAPEIVARGLPDPHRIRELIN